MNRRELLALAAVAPLSVLAASPSDAEAWKSTEDGRWYLHDDLTPEEAIEKLTKYCEQGFERVLVGFQKRVVDLPEFSQQVVKSCEFTFTTIINHMVHGEGDKAPYAATWQEAVHQFQECFDQFRTDHPGNTLFWRVKPQLREWVSPEYEKVGSHKIDVRTGNCLSCHLTEEDFFDLLKSDREREPREGFFDKEIRKFVEGIPCAWDRLVDDPQTRYAVRARVAIGDL